MRELTPRRAADCLRSNDRLAVPLGPGQPGAFLHALGERDDFRDLRVFGALLLDLYPIFARPGVTLLSGFFGPVERALQAAGHDVRFIPSDFRGFTQVARDLRARVMATAVAPAGPDGRFSLSLHAGATTEELLRCGRDPERILIVEVNPELPRTVGLPPEHPHALPADVVDIVIESDRPLPTLPEPDPSDSDRAIAQHVRRYVHDGSTLQTGIGGVPNMVARLLADGDGGDYGIHSEMFTTGLMHLHEAGVVRNHKGLYDGFSPTTFAFGTALLHRWLHENDAVRFLPIELVNRPSLIGRNRNMVSINGALSIDLAGQVVADTLGARQFSGIGGHEDFVAGASHAEGGHSIVCLPSTATANGRVISRIQARLPLGSMVTTPRHQVDVVITEYGAAELRGRTVGDRAEALIAIAHPDVRDALRAGELDVGPAR
ncbi:MAG: acetyl-CoA hydrolase/transferase family protein [Myxococcota bacterium]